MLGPAVKAAHRHAGMTLVELMVGLAVGLVIVAAALALTASHLRESRATLQESRLQHDLQAAVEVVTRDLRRAGYWADAAAGLSRNGTAALDNPYASFDLAASNAAVGFSYSRDESENQRVDDNERFGFRLHAGAIEMLLGSGNWQALTDTGTLVVTALALTPDVRETALDGLCERPCPSTDASCPRLQVRSIDLAITARSTADPALVRSARSRLRLRNDVSVGACPA
jgi:type IV pilus assembly protein PilW